MHIQRKAIDGCLRFSHVREVIEDNDGVLTYAVNIWTTYLSIHFGPYKQNELKGTRHQGRNSTVRSSQLSWAGLYKKCVQYDFKFTRCIVCTVPFNRVRTFVYGTRANCPNVPALTVQISVHCQGFYVFLKPHQTAF